MNLSQWERSTLRDLAKRVAEVASLPEQAEKARSWRRHNRLERGRPMVLVLPEGSWREIIRPTDLLVEDPTYRDYEWYLRSRIYYHEHLKDDNVITNSLRVPIAIIDSGYGVDFHAVRPEEATGAEHYDPVIVSEGDFLDKIGRPVVTVDWEETERRYQAALEVFGDTLKVERFNLSGCWHWDLVDVFARWRGINQFYLDLRDNGRWVHSCLQQLTDWRLDTLDILEREGALSLNNTPDYISVGEYGFMSGGVCYTDELPQADFDGTHVRTQDMWGHATTQLFSQVSPTMHEEFALRYEIQFLSGFGLNGYGCCEPLHHKLDSVMAIPRLRRIAISAWADLSMSAQRIGDRYVLSRKVNPAVLAAPSWDPEAVRHSIRDDLERTKGCVVELILKDVHTVLHQPQRLADWVRVAKEEAQASCE